MTALKSQALLNESVGAGYVERNWPPALAASGAWPLASLRQSFLNGSLTRLLDPDATLRAKIVEFVGRGDFGLASGRQPDGDGAWGRTWFNEPVPAEEITFESGVFLLRKDKAAALGAEVGAKPGPGTGPGTGPEPSPAPSPTLGEEFGPAPAPGLGGTPAPEPDATGPESAPPSSAAAARTIRLSGDVPPEVWNRLGRTLLPKLRGGAELTLGVEFSAKIEGGRAEGLVAEVKQILADLGLSDRMEIR